jgi:hypothetical protein
MNLSNVSKSFGQFMKNKILTERTLRNETLEFDVQAAESYERNRASHFHGCTSQYHSSAMVSYSSAAYVSIHGFTYGPDLTSDVQNPRHHRHSTVNGIYHYTGTTTVAPAVYEPKHHRCGHQYHSHRTHNPSCSLNTNIYLYDSFIALNTSTSYMSELETSPTLSVDMDAALASQAHENAEKVTKRKFSSG